MELAQVSRLLARLGLSGRDAVAEDLLRVVGSQVPLAQCTIFAFDGPGRAPRTVAVGDRARTRNLPDISQAYVERLYRHDGLLPVMAQEWAAAKRADPAQPRILLHRQRPQDLRHAEYRQTCYDAPQVAERVAVLALYEGRRWLSVHLYRGWEHGAFDDAAIQRIEAFAPLIVHTVRLHHTGQTHDQDLSDALLARVLRRYPQLTQRDQDVLRSQMTGHSTEAMAAQLGLTHQSAQTYQKRLYRKLGISSQRELLGLLLEPLPAHS